MLDNGTVSVAAATADAKLGQWWSWYRCWNFQFSFKTNRYGYMIILSLSSRKLSQRSDMKTLQLCDYVQSGIYGLPKLSRRKTLPVLRWLT